MPCNIFLCVGEEAGASELISSSVSFRRGPVQGPPPPWPPGLSHCPNRRPCSWGSAPEEAVESLAHEPAPYAATLEVEAVVDRQVTFLCPQWGWRSRPAGGAPSARATLHATAVGQRQHESRRLRWSNCSGAWCGARLRAPLIQEGRRGEAIAKREQGNSWSSNITYVSDQKQSTIIESEEQERNIWRSMTQSPPEKLLTYFWYVPDF